MNGYAIVHDGNRLALSTRKQLLLSCDEPRREMYVRGEKDFFADSDILLKVLLSKLDWIDIDSVEFDLTSVYGREREYRKGDWRIVCRMEDGNDVWYFSVVSSSSVICVDCCVFRDGVFRGANGHVKSSVLTPNDILGIWADCYRRAESNYLGFDGGWGLQIAWLFRDLVNQSRYDDADELMKCAVARAEREGDQETAEKFIALKHRMMGKISVNNFEVVFCP